jgi:hypothetical protein
LREQDFGNFQNPTKIQADLAERNRFGRFYYRCVPVGVEGGGVVDMGLAVLGRGFLVVAEPEVLVWTLLLQVRF